jgi:signal transduction histidine kinase
VPYLVAALRKETTDQLAIAHQTLLAFDTRLAQELGRIFREKVPDIDPILQQLADAVAENTTATCVDISIQRGDFYEPVARSGQLIIGARAAVDDPLVQHSISVRSIKEKSPQLFTGKRQDALFEYLADELPSDDGRRLVASLRAWGAFPVALGSKVIGALSVASNDWDFFVTWRYQILEAFAKRATLILTIGEAISQQFDTVREQQDRIRSQGIRLNELNQGTGFASAARTLIHNLGNVLSPIGADLEKIAKWADQYKGKFPRKALVDLQSRLDNAEEVFDFYRRLKGKERSKANHDVSALIEEAAEFCEPRARSHSIQIQQNLAPQRLMVFCSDIEMIQAFVNIIINSIEAMTVPGARRGVLSIRSFASGSKVTLKFADEGVGIDPRNTKKLFEVDYTTKSDGTGLGLHHVKRTIEACRGRVGIDGAPMKGATVTITLPLAT